MSDKKDAVTIGVTLSTQIIAASLTMIAVIGAFATFIIDKREVGIFYYIIIGLAFILFVISIFLGGKGIDKARKGGFDGNWSLTETKQLFSWQSLTALLGVVLFSLSVFIGTEKTEELKKQINNQSNAIKIVKQNAKILSEQQSINILQIQELKESIKKMTKELKKIKLLCPTKNIVHLADSTKYEDVSNK